MSRTRTMVMWHKLKPGKYEQRCPYCFSRRLKVLDYDVSDGNEKRFGKYKFHLKCESCGGECIALLNFFDDGVGTYAHGRERELIESEQLHKVQEGA